MLTVSSSSSTSSISVIFFCRNSYDIIALSETWLKPHVPDEFLYGYQLFTFDRVEVGGEGIGMYGSFGLENFYLTQAILHPTNTCFQAFLLSAASSFRYRISPS